uniref:Putative peptidase family m13 n=1 Tax=Amblyomma tuberculatum TaxID=48802 RepID=A0A6M2E5G5_9ACAR
MMAFIYIGLLLLPSLLCSELYSDGQEEGGYYVCTSDVCIERAQLINESLNTSVDPCEDFYTFACGGWLDKYGKGREFYGIPEKMQEDIDNTTCYALKGMNTSTKNQDATEKAAALFQLCIGHEEMQNISADLSEVLIAVEAPEWPLLNNSDTSDKMAKNISEMLLTVGISAICTVCVEETLSLSDWSPVINLNQLALPTMDVNELENYTKVLQKAVKLRRPHINKTEMSIIINTTVNFDVKLRNISSTCLNEDDDSGYFIDTTIGSIEQNFTNIPFLRLLNKEFQKVSINLTEEERVILSTLCYFEGLDALLEQTDPSRIHCENVGTIGRRGSYVEGVGQIQNKGVAAGRMPHPAQTFHATSHPVCLRKNES